jgi:hypothetical protein
MGYKANVISKQFNNGLLTVVIEYTDGITTFTDKMTSRSGQDENWINDEVKRRLSDLDGVEVLKGAIALGQVIPDALPKKHVTPSEPKAEYEANLKVFTAWLEALRQGLVTTDRKAFVELRQWLQDNWIDEYVELFLR